jgi:biofilm PGA synthesis N-glycosyltransferase PgaC
MRIRPAHLAGLGAFAFFVAGLSLLHSRFAIESDSLALRLGVTFVLAFLILLVLRYIALLWLGYLHHIESKVTSDVVVVDEPVTVVVPAFNEGAMIQAAIGSLLDLDYPEYDILIIDDGSTDDTLARARELEGRYGNTTVRVIRKAHGGKASALNTGIALAETPYVVCMDGDCRLSPDTLRHGMRHFADPRVAAVAGNVKVVNRNNVWTKLQALEYIEGLNLTRRAQGFLRAVNIIPGPIGLFRREVLVSVGGFATDTFAEDADLTLTILTAGWQIAYEERAIAWTEAPEELLGLIKQRYRWTRGILQALRKRGGSLTSSESGVVVWVSLQAMLFEAVIWPAMNVLGNLFFSVAALSTGAASAVVYWWLLLTMLDIAAALLSIAMEREDLELVPYALVYRFLFIPIIDVAKLLATGEELARVRMTWGKLERAGRI